MSWTNQTPHSASWTDASKNQANFVTFIRHGTAVFLGDIASKTFTDTIFNDSQQLKDVSFDQLTDQSWTNATKSP